MLRLFTGIFLLLHGMVFLLYAGHSRRLFELAPGLTRPDGSWAFSKLLGDVSTRTLATADFVLTGAALAAGATGVFARQGWWQPAVVGATAFSSVGIFLFWNGGLHRLPDQGGVGLLINLAILVSRLVFKWPALGF